MGPSWLLSLTPHTAGQGTLDLPPRSVHNPGASSLLLCTVRWALPGRPQRPLLSPGSSPCPTVSACPPVWPPCSSASTAVMLVMPAMPASGHFSWHFPPHLCGSLLYPFQGRQRRHCDFHLSLLTTRSGGSQVPRPRSCMEVPVRQGAEASSGQPREASSWEWTLQPQPSPRSAAWPAPGETRSGHPQPSRSGVPIPLRCEMMPAGLGHQTSSRSVTRQATRPSLPVLLLYSLVDTFAFILR